MTVKDRIRSILEEVARKGDVVTYQALATSAGINPPHSIHKTTTAVEDLIAEDHRAGAPLLGALVVSRTNGIPAPGFFGCLTTHGRYFGPDVGPEAQAHWQRECDAVYKAYKLTVTPSEGTVSS